MLNLIKLSKKGFTLLEMLVVIGIIGVFVGMGAVTYSSAQKKSRDSKRKGDLKVIQNALEQYYSVCKTSPFTYPESIASDITCTDPSVTIIASADMPKDPKTNANYAYTYTAATNTYTICAPNSPPLETESTTPYCNSNQQ